MELAATEADCREPLTGHVLTQEQPKVQIGLHP